MLALGARMVIVAHAAAQHRGHDFKLISGQHISLVPLPMSHNADKLEQADLAGVKNYPTLHPDIHTLIHKTDLGDPNVVAAKRTEAGTRQVSRPAPTAPHGSIGTLQLMTDPNWEMQLVSDAQALVARGQLREAADLMHGQSFFAAREVQEC